MFQKGLHAEVGQGGSEKDRRELSRIHLVLIKGSGSAVAASNGRSKLDDQLD